MTERAGLVPIKQQHSDKHWLFQSHLIAVFLFLGSILALSVCFADTSPKGRGFAAAVAK